MSRENLTCPKARRKKLEIRELPNETLIYDKEAKSIHYLDEPTTLIWNKCDGKTEISTIENSLSDRINNRFSSAIDFLIENRLIT